MNLREDPGQVGAGKQGRAQTAPRQADSVGAGFVESGAVVEGAYRESLTGVDGPSHLEENFANMFAVAVAVVVVVVVVVVAAVLVAVVAVFAVAVAVVVVAVVGWAQSLAVADDAQVYRLGSEFL